MEGKERYRVDLFSFKECFVVGVVGIVILKFDLEIIVNVICINV